MSGDRAATRAARPRREAKRRQTYDADAPEGFFSDGDDALDDPDFEPASEEEPDEDEPDDDESEDDEPSDDFEPFSLLSFSRARRLVP